MKYLLLKSIILISLILISINGFTQSVSCPVNLDFETGAIAPWQCFLGVCCPISTTSSVPTVNRHTITSGAGLDPYGSFPIVFPGGTYSLRLGNDNIHAEAEKVRYNVHVPPVAKNFILVYRFAVVFEDPGHKVPEQPRFEVNLFDSATGKSLPCGYVSYISSSTLPGFKASPKIGTGGAPVYYHAWDSASVNLSGYGGSTIMLDFSTGDCSLGGHFGYAYVDVNCRPPIISSSACDTVSPITLSAPPGFSTYTWYDSATFTIVYGSGSPAVIPNPHKPQTYAVVMTPYAGLGCTDTLYTHVIPTALTLHPSKDTAICIGNSTTLVSGATDVVGPLTYSWAPSTGLSCTSCASTIATPTTSTVYTLTVTNPYGCTKDTMITVNVGPPITPITGPSTVCVGASITLSCSSPGGVWSCTSPNVTLSSGVVTGVSAGTAVISYALTSLCGTSVVRKTITVFPLPVAGIITGPIVVCQSNSITLSSSVSGGVWSSTSPIASLSPAGVVTGIATGTAVITYSVTNSCGTAMATYTITVDPLPVTGTISGVSAVCIGSSITLSSSAPGGVWSFSSSHITMTPAGVVTGVSAGTATISYTVTNACGSASATFTVTVDAPPIAIITGPATICVGTSAAFTGISAGGTWSYTGAAITMAPGGIVNTVSAGTATVSYTVTNSCGTKIATSVVTVLPLPSTATISGPVIVCVSSSIVLTASVAGGTWSSGSTCATVSPAGVVTGISSGTAVISYTLTNACGNASATHTVTVEVPLITAITGPTAVCVGGTITLTGTPSGGTWTISGPSAAISSGGVVTGISAGSATVKYAATNSCGTAVTTTTITVNPLPDPGVISGGPSVCTTDSIVMTETVAGGVWSCTSNASISPTGILTGLTAGTDTVSYTVTNICGIATATFPITINLTPSPGVLSGPTHICVGSSVILSSTVSGGTWSSSFPAIAPVVSTGEVYGIATGTVTITYTVHNTFCSSNITTTVTVDSIVVPGIITGTTTACEGGTITLSSSKTGGVWSCSNPAVSIAGTGIVTGLTTGTALVSYTVTNMCGPKTTTKTITINPLPDPGIITGPKNVCAGASIALSDPSNIGTGIWISDNTTVATVSGIGVVTGISSGTSMITYSVTTSAGCTGLVNYMVTVLPVPPDGSISGPPQLCAGLPVTLTETASGGTWTSTDTSVATINAVTGETHIVRPGAVTITYTGLPNILGCSNMDTFLLKILSSAPFTIKETLTNISCKGRNDGSIAILIVGGKGPWQYTWSNGGTSPAITELTPGSYDLKVSDVTTGCDASEKYKIIEPDSLNVTAEVTKELCDQSNGAVTLAVMGGTAPYYYKWSNKKEDDRIANLPAGVYTVTVTDYNSCEQQLSADVTRGDCREIVVHDGMSPNGDGINDLWSIDGIEIYKDNLVQLFDKWGDKVFEQRGYKNKWDGRGRNGSLIPDGTYFYIIKLNAENGAGGNNVLTGALLIKR